MERVKLELSYSHDAGMECGFTLGCSNNNQVILRGAGLRSPQDYKIGLFDNETGDQIAEWPSVCSHRYCPVIEVSFEKGGRSYFAESCPTCSRITFYDTDSKAQLLAWSERKTMPARLLQLGDGTILMSDLAGDKIIKLQWDAQNMQLQQSDWVLDLDLGTVTGMAFLEKRRLLVMVAKNKKIVRAYDYPTGKVKWELSGIVEGKAIQPRSLCCDPVTGLVYVSDYQSERVLVLEGHTGKSHQVVLKESWENIYEVQWNSQQPHLAVKHGQDKKGKFSVFKVKSA